MRRSSSTNNTTDTTGSALLCGSSISDSSNFPCNLSISDHGIVWVMVSLSFGTGILSLLFVRYYLYRKVMSFYLYIGNAERKSVIVWFGSGLPILVLGLIIILIIISSPLTHLLHYIYIYTYVGRSNAWNGGITNSCIGFRNKSKMEPEHFSERNIPT